jgi:2,3-bisphosphoglycerate-dependent phosphoglycerate mutase
MSRGAGTSRLESLFLADHDQYGELILVRHAQQGVNALGDPARPKGGDAPLSANGLKQAAALATWLGRERVDAVWASPLQRTRQTAAPTGAAHGLTPVVDDDLVELGTYRDIPLGKTVDDVVPADQLERVWENFARDQRWDAFPLSESVADLYSRLDRVLARITAAHGEDDRIVVVCHGVVISALVARLVRSSADMLLVPAHASITRLARGDGRLALRSVNETAHLRHLAEVEVTF